MKQEKTFYALLASIVFLIVYTGINNLIYNWVYLNKVYNKPIEKWGLIKFEVLAGYWNWMPGKILCVINILIFLIILYFWFKIKRQSPEKLGKVD